ncbi:hypothetical protein COCNU_01G004540 [Cocos nucifera]|uniref:Uncharacterized protein n=1 Tax=Cocos nucifera TaxID=13894 RepID=A0A8K0HTY6_COCNU|nr:hypothetical protein COCNU_01G004540 [Cocos nucifera]
MLLEYAVAGYRAENCYSSHQATSSKWVIYFHSVLTSFQLDQSSNQPVQQVGESMG